MSKLRIYSNISEVIELNVVGFSSPVQQQIPSVQAKKMLLHFPYMVTQPTVTFQVVFVSEQDYEAFQAFVRLHHVNSISEDYDKSAITLKWPERGINNWTGYIKAFQAGGERFNYAPRGECVVDLVDSFISRKTLQSSLGSPVTKIMGPQIREVIGGWFQMPKAPRNDNVPIEPKGAPSIDLPPTQKLPQPNPIGGGP